MAWLETAKEQWVDARVGSEGRAAMPALVAPTAQRWRTARRVARYWQLYAMLALPVLYFLIFCYWPMYGATIAFRDFDITKGILGSPWVGFTYFQQFFALPAFWQYIRNTVFLSLYSIVAGFPIPIILALALNEVRLGWFKRTVQMVTFAPYFISTVVMVGMILQVLSLRNGLLNNLIMLLGGRAIDFMGNSDLFRSIYVWTAIWQTAGYGAILYMAALSQVDPTLYEAARVDGASRFQRMLHVDVPALVPTIVILLILTSGSILNVGFEKVFLMQNPLNTDVSEILATFIYKVGLVQAQYSLAAAIGLFNSVINFGMLLIVNWLAGRVSGNSLW